MVDDGGGVLSLSTGCSAMSRLYTDVSTLTRVDPYLYMDGLCVDWME